MCGLLLPFGSLPAGCAVGPGCDAEDRTLPRLWNVHDLCNGRSAFGIARLLGKAAVRPNPGACFHQKRMVCTYPPWFQSPRSDPHRVMPLVACLRGLTSSQSFHAASASGCDLRRESNPLNRYQQYRLQGSAFYGVDGAVSSPTEFNRSHSDTASPYTSLPKERIGPIFVWLTCKERVNRSIPSRPDTRNAHSQAIPPSRRSRSQS